MCSCPRPPDIRFAMHLMFVTILLPVELKLRHKSMSVGALTVCLYRYLLSSMKNASTLNFFDHRSQLRWGLFVRAERNLK
jgi:hypothetical protein